MTTEFSQASLNVPEAGSPASTATSTTIIHTPPSEESAHSPNPSAHPPPRRPSPLNLGLPGARSQASGRRAAPESSAQIGEASESDNESEEGAADMLERPGMHRANDGRSQMPLLKDEGGRSPGSPLGLTGVLDHLSLPAVLPFGVGVPALKICRPRGRNIPMRPSSWY